MYASYHDIPFHILNMRLWRCCFSQNLSCQVPGGIGWQLWQRSSCPAAHGTPPAPGAGGPALGGGVPPWLRWTRSSTRNDAGGWKCHGLGRGPLEGNGNNNGNFKRTHQKTLTFGLLEYVKIAEVGVPKVFETNLAFYIISSCSVISRDVQIFPEGECFNNGSQDQPEVSRNLRALFAGHSTSLIESCAVGADREALGWCDPSTTFYTQWTLQLSLYHSWLIKSNDFSQWAGFEQTFSSTRFYLFHFIFKFSAVFLRQTRAALLELNLEALERLGGGDGLGRLDVQRELRSAHSAAMAAKAMAMPLHCQVRWEVLG